MAWDRDPAAVQTYNGNRPSGPKAELSDLAAADPVDLLQQWDAISPSPPLGIVGGPPCQPFSLGNVHRLVDDPRAQMPLVFAAVLDAAARRYEGFPRFFLMENVAGLTTRPHKDLLAEILNRFRKPASISSNPSSWMPRISASRNDGSASSWSASGRKMIATVSRYPAAIPGPGGRFGKRSAASQILCCLLAEQGRRNRDCTRTIGA